MLEREVMASEDRTQGVKALESQWESPAFIQWTRKPLQDY